MPPIWRPFSYISNVRPRSASDLATVTPDDPAPMMQISLMVGPLRCGPHDRQAPRQNSHPPQYPMPPHGPRRSISASRRPPLAPADLAGIPPRPWPRAPAPPQPYLRAIPDDRQLQPAQQQLDRDRRVFAGQTAIGHAPHQRLQKQGFKSVAAGDQIGHDLLLHIAQRIEAMHLPPCATTIS